MFVLESGRLQVEMVTPEGTRVRLRTVLPGVVVGEIAMYSGVPRTADVVAEDAERRPAAQPCVDRADGVRRPGVGGGAAPMARDDAVRTVERHLAGVRFLARLMGLGHEWKGSAWRERSSRAVGCSTEPERRISDADVAIEDGRIVEVGPGLDGDEGVDVTGQTLLPGLFDCHVHLAFRHEDFDEVRVMNEPFSATASSGSRRTCGSRSRWGSRPFATRSGADGGLKLAVAEGCSVGPRMQISVNMLSMTGGHSDACLPSGGIGAVRGPTRACPPACVDGPESLRKVREMIRAGADVIKIASSAGSCRPATIRAAELLAEPRSTAIVATAADLGTWVMSHAHGAEGIQRAVRAGVRSIDHGTYLDEEGVSLMLERGTWLVPTLTAGDTTDALAEDPRIPTRSARSCAGWDGPSSIRSGWLPRPV